MTVDQIPLVSALWAFLEASDNKDHTPEPTDAVIVSTIQSAKGLEGAVALTGLT
jgi:hypothetical protein